MRLLRGKRFAAPLVLGGIAAPAIAFAHASIDTHLQPLSSLLICALPAFIVLISIGITSLSDFFPYRAYRPYFTLVIGAAYLTLYSVLTVVEGGDPTPPQSVGGVDLVEFVRGGKRWKCYQDGRVTRETDTGIDRSIRAER
jgi:hypothetical protein